MMDMDEYKDKDMDMGMDKDDFHGALTGFMEQAYNLQQKCQQILQQCYDKKEIILPVDIVEVVRRLGVSLVSEDLNCGSEGGIDMNIASLRYENKNGDAVIYVSNEKNQDVSKGYSDLQKYAIAYELGKIIINNRINNGEASKMRADEVRKWNMTSTPYSLPRLYAQWESFAYEMCAIFLLLPLDSFLEEFSSYVKKAKEYPVIMDKWIKHLGDKAGIPNYQLINGYQYIKFCACQYYQENYAIGAVDKGGELGYRELYR